MIVIVKGFETYTIFSTFTFWLLFCLFMTEIQAYWKQRFFNLANKIFTKKDILQE